MTELSIELIAQLKSLAKSSVWSDDIESEDDWVDVDGYAGGNVDDAYQGGVADGETQLARTILTNLGISWTD